MERLNETDAVAQARETYNEVVIANYESLQGEAGIESEDAAWAKVVEAVERRVRADLLASITHDSIVADIPLRGANPDAIPFVADVLLAVRGRLRAAQEGK